MVWILILIAFIGLISFAAYMTWQENKEMMLKREFNKIKKGDRYVIKGVKNPFNISDKQIALIIGKDTSPENNENYVQFICDGVKYSCSVSEFIKSWNAADNCERIKDIEIDTTVGIKQKHFSEFDADTIRKK